MESVVERPKNARSQGFGFSYGKLYINLRLHSYKIQITQELKPRDQGQCWIYANWV